MTYIFKHPILLVSLVLWLGFVLAISFMEAWLKFRAPGVTLPIGLSIGRLIFNVLNKIEWLFMGIAIIHILFNRMEFNLFQLLISLVLLIILILQTFWLLPLLDARAELYIQGMQVESSYLHLYYVIGEILKVTALIFLFISLIKPVK